MNDAPNKPSASTPQQGVQTTKPADPLAGSTDLTKGNPLSIPVGAKPDGASGMVKAPNPTQAKPEPDAKALFDEGGGKRPGGPTQAELEEKGRAQRIAQGKDPHINFVGDAEQQQTEGQAAFGRKLDALQSEWSALMSGRDGMSVANFHFTNAINAARAA